MKPSTIRRQLLTVGFVILLAGCGPEGPYPNRTMRIICPWAVGGGTDTHSRILAEMLKEEVGQQVNVVTRTGGAGVTGHSAGARANPDGYTLTMMTVEINMLHWLGLTKISWEDFRLVAMINQDPAALLVRNEAPWESPEDITEAARKSPGKLRASGTAVGGIWHLALTGWLIKQGLGPKAITWIPSTGAAPSLVELMGEGVDMVTCSLPEAKTQIADGSVRPIAVMADERSKSFPQVPTFKELGVDWSLAGWRGIGVPKGTPDEVAGKLERLVQKVVDGEEYRQQMESFGFDVRFVGSSEFNNFLGEQDALLGTLLKQSGLAN